jgi:predicted RNase H-like HicB family nuclease
MDYIVVIEKAEDGSYSAYLPDLPGCVACGDTADEARELIAEAVQLHIESLREHGEPVPQPAASTAVVHAA